MNINENNHTSLTYQDKIKIENKVKLRELLDEMPDFCREFFRGVENQTSSITRISYAYDLKLFFEYLLHYSQKFKNRQDVKEFVLSDLEKLSPTDIEEYLEYLSYYVKDNKEHTNDEAGLKRKITSLRSFYNYFYRKESIKYNPASFIKTPKIHTKEIVRLDINEVAQLLDMVESGEQLSETQKKYHNKTKVRDLALLTLLLGTGIRVSECVGIDISDIDFNNWGIKITRKGGNESMIYFGDEIYQALTSYLDERTKTTACEGHENALFLSMQHKRMSVRSVELLVKKYSKLVTTVKHITPHKLRSTYGTNLYQETGDIYLVADVLGHKDVNTTKRHYAAVDDTRRRSAANKVQLREKDN